MDLNTNNTQTTTTPDPNRYFGNSDYPQGFRSANTGYYQQSVTPPTPPVPPVTPTSSTAPKQQPPRKKKSGVAKRVWLGVGIGLGALLLGILGTLFVTRLTQNVHFEVNGKTIIGQDRDADSERSGYSDTDKETAVAKADSEVLEKEDEPVAVESEADDSYAYETIDSTGLTPSVALTTVTDVTEVVKAVMPSVVAVNNKYTAKMNYFGQIYSQEAESAGSGIIVGQNDTELLLVTNNHVVEDADELAVTFVDDEQAPAKIKGTDADKDLAVIAINLADIPSDTRKTIKVAELGDSEALTVGEPVVAIGNSLGYGQSVTTGVVSALHRTIGANGQGYGRGDYSIEDAPTFIQTDAAINPGNSGGALLNINGQVIGINSNKIGGSSVEGMGYAIPISDAKPIIENLMNRQTRDKVSEDNRGFLGITGVNVEEDTSEEMGIPKGVYVYSVNEDSAADRAGLVRGDIIVGLDGQEIRSMEELKAELEYYSIGDTVTLTVMQSSPTGYRSVQVTVTLQGAEG